MRNPHHTLRSRTLKHPPLSLTEKYRIRGAPWIYLVALHTIPPPRPPFFAHFVSQLLFYASRIMSFSSLLSNASDSLSTGSDTTSTSSNAPPPVSDPLSAVLNEDTTIRFQHGSESKADLGRLDLTRNPQQTRDGYVWFLPSREEATITLIGKVTYSVIGDKTGPYFSLCGPNAVRITILLCRPLLQRIADMVVQKPKPVLTELDMAKLRTGFAIRTLIDSLPEDEPLPKKLFDHQKAVLDYFFTIQEEADKLIDGGAFLLFSGPPTNSHLIHILQFPTTTTKPSNRSSSTCRTLPVTSFRSPATISSRNSREKNRLESFERRVRGVRLTLPHGTSAESDFLFP